MKLHILLHLLAPPLLPTVASTCSTTAPHAPSIATRLTLRCPAPLCRSASPCGEDGGRSPSPLWRRPGLGMSYDSLSGREYADAMDAMESTRAMPATNASPV
jgi:hypothetical protein